MYVRMYTCIYVYMYIYIYIYIHTYARAHVCVCVCVCVEDIFLEFVSWKQSRSISNPNNGAVKRIVNKP